jgi:hypothetical protein
MSGSTWNDFVASKLRSAGGTSECWTGDLCFWPDAWQATEEAKQVVDGSVGRFVV